MREYENKKDVIFDNLRKKITSGEYAAGFKFPSEPVIAKELGVGRVTLRSALERLRQAGLVIRVPGKGTFVMSDEERSRTSKCILILFDNSLNPLETSSQFIIPAFEEACKRLNIKTDFVNTSFLRAGNEDHVVETLRKNNYSGVLLDGFLYNGNEKELDILRKLNIPVLIPHGSASDSQTTGFAVMHCDFKKGWIEGFEYLFSQGHRRFGILGKLQTKKLRGFQEPEYERFLIKHKITPDPELIKYVDFENKSIFKAIDQLMSMSHPPTAIMCYSDLVCVGVYKRLGELGFRIPEDVAVMGFCGYPGLHLLSPSLTTVDHKYAEIGQMAADVLNRANEWFGKKGIAVPRIVTPHELIVRGSTDIKRIEKQLVNLREIQGESGNDLTVRS